MAPGPGTAIRVGTSNLNGNGATLTVAGAWTSTSDRTKKHNITNINYGLSEILKLRAVSYKWNGTDQPDFGFIAQEVKDVLPEIVYGEEGQMSISYGQVSAVLVKAVQEQQKEIEELKTKLSRCEIQVETLEITIQNSKTQNSQITALSEELENIKKILGMEANAKK
ncbi:MAG: tail fiber domain-containing protein [Flammeovirgaceae bacterium]|nr:tail fiber domain-containing protein [Flammeovirgaceae bacterium]